MDNKSQGSAEYMIAVSFMLLSVMVVFILASQKEQEIYDFKVSLEAEMVAKSVAANINMVSTVGHGYYRHFSVPEVLHGYINYNITIEETSVVIYYGQYNWATNIITPNVVIVSFEKGETKQICVNNIHGQIIVGGVC